jgi:predicted AAA+ superfamily ATPase
MPAVVAADVAGVTPRDLRDRQRDLIAAVRDDFTKYAGRMVRAALDGTLLSVAASLGQKFVYARASEGVKQHQAKRALELLAAARVCHLVRFTAANGLPLGGQTKDTFRKAILLDVGLLHALVGTPAERKFPEPGQLAPAIRGQLAEQLIGQALRLLGETSGSGPELYYWQREGGRPGEIDYVAELSGRIVPVELKSGASGAMKSLHQFMHDKHLDLAVRFDTNAPSVNHVDVLTTQADRVSYHLLSLPAYLAFRLPVALGELDRTARGAPRKRATRRSAK